MKILKFKIIFLHHNNNHRMLKCLKIISFSESRQNRVAGKGERKGKLKIFLEFSSSSIGTN